MRQLVIAPFDALCLELWLQVHVIHVMLCAQSSELGAITRNTAARPTPKPWRLEEVLQNCQCQPPVLYKFQSSDSRTQFTHWKTHSLFLLDHVLAKAFYLIFLDNIVNTGIVVYNSSIDFGQKKINCLFGISAIPNYYSCIGQKCSR
jgi:hypothetical protein